MAFPFRKPYLKRVIRGLLVASALYIVTLGALSLGERHLLYLPFPGAETPHEAGLEGFSRQTFTTADGLELPYWESTDAPTDAPLVIYLHGNAGGLHAFAPYFKTLREQKLHILAMEYRGYAQAPGKPSEKAIVGDAVTFYDAVKQHYPNRQISIWGFSLGTGVAAQLAAARPAAAVVLEAPFSSTVDLAQHYYRIFPVRHLMQDQFLSQNYIAKINAPLLVLHGDEDVIVPIRFGRALFNAAIEPKQFNEYKGYGHLDLNESPAYSEAAAFLRNTLN